MNEVGIKVKSMNNRDMIKKPRMKNDWNVNE
jgi:hypothetical protein